MKFVRWMAVTSVAAAACVAGVSAVAPFDGTTTATRASVLVADEAPGYAVEDFNYPQADKIEAEKGIVLKRGDGHIVLAECGSEAGLLEIYTRAADKVCFRTTGDSGYLSLEIKSVYGVKGATDLDADMTLQAPDGTPQEITVPKDSFTPVGESVDPEGQEHMLVEISTSK